MLPGYGVHFLLFISLIFYAETMNCETIILYLDRLRHYFFNNFIIRFFSNIVLDDFRNKTYAQ